MYLNRCGKYTGKKINPNPTPRDGVIRGSTLIDACSDKRPLGIVNADSTDWHTCILN